MSAPLSDDVTAVIAPQHEEARRLLRQVGQSTGQARREAFHRLRLMLALHETAEELAVHPQAVRQLGSDSAGASSRVEEEEDAGKMIAELERLDVDSDEFGSKFEDLSSAVAAHAAAEEEQEWPALRAITDGGIIRVMTVEMSAVPDLADDPAAPKSDASFEEMQQWASTRLPAPPSVEPG